MWIWLGGILILLLLMAAALVLLSKITFRLKVRKENRDDMILLDITSLYGLVSIHYRVPTILLDNLEDGLRFEKKRIDNVFKDRMTSGEDSINKETIDHWLEELRRMMEGTRGFKKWLKSTLRRVSFSSFEWSTNIALSDAAHTATLTGVLWGLKTSLIGWLTYHISLRQRPKLFVVPVFGSKPLFSTELCCIAEIRCGYAIYAGLVLVVRVLKVKGGVKKWLTILFKG